jgi:hypothetical protein
MADMGFCLSREDVMRMALVIADDLSEKRFQEGYIRCPEFLGQVYLLWRKRRTTVCWSTRHDNKRAVVDYVA